MVVGTSGSGKTTFARSLAWALGRAHIELDALHWGPDWTPRPEFPDPVRAAVAAETWIFDGNYSRVRDLVWERATAVVWLNYPFHVVFGRALVRTIRRVLTRNALYSGNRETIRGAFLARDGICASRGSGTWPSSSFTPKRRRRLCSSVRVGDEFQAPALHRAPPENFPLAARKRDSLMRATGLALRCAVVYGRAARPAPPAARVRKSTAAVARTQQ